MEALTLTNRTGVIENTLPVPTNRSPFIEANTKPVSLTHLKQDCIIPVFSKDNESTISHGEFVEVLQEVSRQLFPGQQISAPDIRVSHVVKGRIPSAVGKPANQLKESEKTIYYERCAIVLEVPELVKQVNGNTLALSLGGVRAYNQENLYSKKSPEKFKVFVGFQNRVCTNLCISTDGFSNAIRAMSVHELQLQCEQVLSQYDPNRHLAVMQQMQEISITEAQFAYMIGRMRMYQFLGAEAKGGLFPFSLNDGHINKVVKDYYTCPNFGREADGSLSLWKLYNLLTEANKSSYIDRSLERHVNAYEFVREGINAIETGEPNWFYHH
jgi:hypothetical protein